jgi:hypothetical protein
MPFKSEKQRKWMWANDPEMAKKWEKEEKMKRETKVRKLIRKMVGEIMKEDFAGAYPKSMRKKFDGKRRKQSEVLGYTLTGKDDIRTEIDDATVQEAKKRDYKAEYKKFQSSTKSKKYRAELNKYNRQKGTYGNGDGKDASHKGGKIAGFEEQSKNRGRREKSRLKKEGKLTETTLSKMLSKMIKEPEGSIKKFMKKTGHAESGLLDFVEKLTRNSSSKRKQHIKVLKSAIKGDKKAEKHIEKTLYGEGKLNEEKPYETILRQLGGNRFIAMTGAKNLGTSTKKDLSFSIGRNAKKVTHVKITLTSADLYDVKFINARGAKIKVIKEVKGVYGDMLPKIFKKYTGMNVRL